MRFTFHNLGKIRETELVLRPLTVIIGPNNTNKTYIAYSIYGLWQAAANQTGGFDSLYSRLTMRESKLPQETNAEGTIRLVINEDIVRILNESYNELSQGFVKQIGTFFQDSTSALFPKTTLGLHLTLQDIESACIRAVSNPTRFYQYSFDEGVFTATPTPESTPEEGLYGEIRRLVLSHNRIMNNAAETAIQKELFSTPYLLPAERNAFVLTYKVLANRRLKLLLENQRRLLGKNANDLRQVDLLRESGEVRFPQPIEDFLELLTSIELGEGPRDSATSISDLLTIEPMQVRSEISKIADFIEFYLQGDNKTSFSPTKLGGHEMKVTVNSGLNIDLYNASSSIKQLAPLVLYLRYRAQPNDLLIIDEPEMNLHPESQAKLLEALSMCVNAGIRVLVTTHSPYIMAHLNNLVQPETSEALKRKIASDLYLKEESAILREDQVSAYEMRAEDGGNVVLHDLHDPAYGIRWETLSDVSEELQATYFNMSAKREAAGNEQAGQVRRNRSH